MLKYKKRIVFLLTVIAVFQFSEMGFCQQIEKRQSTIMPLRQVRVDTRKQILAQQLSDWTQSTLFRKKAVVAVVARRGGKDVRRHDKTGMAHAGIAIYDPHSNVWSIYNLVQDKATKAKRAPCCLSDATASVLQTTPLNFFYNQSGYVKDALILIPDLELQQRVYSAFLDGSYQKLNSIRKYNLLSPYDTWTSYNCDKWILFNVMAAKTNQYDFPSISHSIDSDFSPALISLSPVEKYIIHHKSNVILRELPPRLPYKVVTVESLYRSDLFADRIFYSGRKHL